MDRFSFYSSNDGRPQGRRWDEVDTAMLALIRLVLDDSWSAQWAAAALRVRVVDESVIRRVRTRVENALADRPTPVARRAKRTLDVLLGDDRREPALASSGY